MLRVSLLSLLGGALMGILVFTALRAISVGSWINAVENGASAGWLSAVLLFGVIAPMVAALVVVLMRRPRGTA